MVRTTPRRPPPPQRTLLWMAAGGLLACGARPDATRVDRALPARARAADAATESSARAAPREGADRQGPVSELAPAPDVSARAVEGPPATRLPPVDVRSPASQAAIEACERLDAAAGACRVLSTGSLCSLVPTDVEACRAECLARAPCGALTNSVCGRLETPASVEVERTPESTLAACLTDCAFACDDDITIAARWRCDGTLQCRDGSDEAGCPARRFECDDGRQLPSSWACDGQIDCPSASDESDCSGVPVLDCTREG